MSEKSAIADLAADYAAAWAEVQHVVKNAHNPHFKSNYADLGAVLDTVRPVFAKYGLVLLQSPGVVAEVGGVLVQHLQGVLIHKSGQNIPMNMSVPIGMSPTVALNAPPQVDKYGKPKVPEAATAQKSVAAVSYMRRIQLAAVGGIAQVDDDGNTAAGTEEPAEEKPDHTDLVKRIKACTDYYELNGTGKGKGLKKSQLRLEVEATNDTAVVELWLAKREELKKTKDKGEAK